MRILHTSDWHIGQQLHRKNRMEEHQLFFDWLLEQLSIQEIDVLLVAGDIFDVGYPSNSALEQYYRFLTRCSQTNCKQIIITGGNHDYISTLDAPKSILKALNISVIGGAETNMNNEIIPLKDTNNNMCGYICAVPYLRDRDIRKSVAGESYDERLQATRQGILNHYQQVAELVAQQNSNNLPVIGMGHLYMAGASTSDSERDIQIGNEAAVQWNNFPDSFDYMALGHIHRAQKVAKQEHVRYCGSPIPLSFSEKKDEKVVIIADFDSEKCTNIKTLPVPCFRKLISYSGTIQEVAEHLEKHRSQQQLTDWAEIKITEPAYDPEKIQQYKRLLDRTFDVEIIYPSITFTAAQNRIAKLYEEQPSLDSLQHTEVFEKLLEKSEIENKTVSI